MNRTVCVPFSTIIITSEDGTREWIKPRLMVAGANLSKIKVLTDIIMPDGSEVPFHAVNSLDILEKTIKS